MTRTEIRKYKPLEVVRKTTEVGGARSEDGGVKPKRNGTIRECLVFYTHSSLIENEVTMYTVGVKSWSGNFLPRLKVP